MLGFGLPYPEVDAKLFGNGRSSPTNHATVKLNAKILLTVD